MANDTFGLMIAIIGGAWLIGQAIEKGFKQLGNHMAANREQLDRLAGNVDILGGRVNGIYLKMKDRA